MDSHFFPILHIATDEKFIDAAYEIYEAAFPGQSQFLILLANRDEKIKHISAEKGYKFIYLDGDWYNQKITNKLYKAEYIVFHGMNIPQAELALKLEASAKLIWTSFGFETYGNPEVRGLKLFGNKTFKRFFGLSYIIKKALRHIYYTVAKLEGSGGTKILEALKKMDVAAIAYEEEYDLFKKLSLIRKDSEQIVFTYYPIDIIIKPDSPFVSENNILLGNSASFTNNHLEAFDIIKKLGYENSKIITPLSYGSQEYATVIAQEGRRLFNKSFLPLTAFLPLKEYQQITQSCGIVIMNHYRQQAVGNVFDMMYRGAKVYLSERNTLYHYLKRIGCHVCSIEKDLNMDNVNVLSLLSAAQMIQNRAILYKELNLNRLITQLRECIKLNILD